MKILKSIIIATLLFSNFCTSHLFSMNQRSNLERRRKERLTIFLIEQLASLSKAELLFAINHLDKLTNDIDIIKILKIQIPKMINLNIEQRRLALQQYNKSLSTNQNASNFIKNLEEKIQSMKPSKEIVIAKTNFSCLECERLQLLSTVNFYSENELINHTIEYHVKSTYCSNYLIFKCACLNCKSFHFPDLNTIAEHIYKNHTPKTQNDSFLPNYLPQTPSKLRRCTFIT